MDSVFILKARVRVLISPNSTGIGNNNNSQVMLGPVRASYQSRHLLFIISTDKNNKSLLQNNRSSFQRIFLHLTAIALMTSMLTYTVLYFV
mmetsp:Transcript_19705/g.22319  ORF Transcript_19705/g.22319 Transcript_19705/m.22319 type:complete len:91 (+) Transcript_19705:822-1094(+)